MMLACCARFSCCFTTVCRAFCVSSGRATSTICAATSNARATLPRQKKTLRCILAKPNQVLYYPAIIAPDSDIAKDDKLIVDLEARADFLLTGPRIDRAHVYIEAIKNCVTLGRLAFLENFPVELLHQQHCGASGQHIAISRQFFSGGAGGDRESVV